MYRLRILALTFMCAVALTPLSPVAAQSATPVQSVLLGVALPDSTTLSRNFLYQQAAKYSLKLDANRLHVVLGPRLEVFRLALSGPPQAAIVASLQAAGWTVTMDPTTPTTALADKAGSASVLVEFVTGKKDRWLYTAEVAPRAAEVTTMSPPVPAEAQPLPAPQSPVPPSAPPPPVEQSAPPAPPLAAVRTSTPPPVPTADVAPAPPTGATGAGYAFSTTNFDDGWTSTIGSEYVTITKGDIRILQHFKRAEESTYMSVLEEQTRLFWNLLVAPRYRDLANLVVERNNPGGYEPINYASGTATEVASGRRVYIVLFFHPNRRTGWMEFVTPDQATFEREFGPYRSSDTQWDRWIAMAGRNRFAVAPRDFVGSWSDNFAAGTSMVFSATGRAAGMLYAGGNTTVTFSGGTYTMDVAGGSGMVGSIRMQNATYRGAFSVVDNWNIAFENNFEGRTRRFHASFEGIRDGRVLNLVLDEPGAPITLHMVRIR